MPKIEWSAVKRPAKMAGEIGLFPADAMAAEELDRIKDGAETLTSTKTPRNPRQHRLAWALAQKLAESVDTLHDRDDAMALLKIKARHVRWMSDPQTGSMWPVPQSISFASLSQEQFGRLFDRFVWIICNELVPGIDEDDLRREVLELVDGDAGRRAREHDARYGTADRRAA